LADYTSEWAANHLSAGGAIRQAQRMSLY